MSSQEFVRHRASSPDSCPSRLSLAISRSARPAIKTSAAFLISGAMVASLALPAAAATSAATSAASIRVASAPVGLAAAVAGVAPSAAQAPLAPRTFGNIAFTGVVKPKPKPKPKPVVVKRAVVPVSRSTQRSALPATSTPTRKVRSAAPSSSSGGVLGIAAGLAGISYLYGGTTTAGFDCSGYTQYVFAKVGISLPRTAEQQRQAVTPVTNPQPGDLVFIGAPAHHMGIYAGNGKMWDSPRTGKAIALRDIWSSTPTYGRP